MSSALVLISTVFASVAIAFDTDEAPAQQHVAVPSSGCGKPAPVKPGVSTDQLLPIHDPVSGNITRVYRLHLPSNYNPNTPYYFVIDYHGYYDNAKNEEREDKLPEYLSDQKGVIFVYPYGSNDSKSSLYSWDAGGTTANQGPDGYVCATNRQFWGEYECYYSCGNKCNPKNTCYCSSCWSDIDFIEELLNVVESSVCIDKAHMHATGISAGGMMVYQSAVSFSNIFASIVPVAGSLLLGFGAQRPQYPIALMDWHGLNDHIIPSNVTNSYQYPKYIAPDGATWSSDGFYYTPTGNFTALYANVDGCQTGNNHAQHYPTAYDGQHQLYCWKPYGDCGHGTDVVQCVGQWGHTWPLHTTPQAYADLLWQFISTHPKQNVVWKE